MKKEMQRGLIVACLCVWYVEKLSPEFRTRSEIGTRCAISYQIAAEMFQWLILMRSEQTFDDPDTYLIMVYACAQRNLQFLFHISGNSV